MQQLKCDICGIIDFDLQISEDIDKIYRCGACRNMYMFGGPLDTIDEFERVLSEDYRVIEPINVG